jgi:hypothetical protein
MKSTYRDKGTTFSCSELTKPSYQLWVSKHAPQKEDRATGQVSFKSYLGSALHSAIEKVEEPGVIKEFTWTKEVSEGVTLGGTADELRYRYSINKWRLGDVKLKGVYPTKKFLGIGTKANPNPKPEQEKEQLQMSIYRWLFEGLFDIEDKAVIYLFVQGHSKREAFPEYQEVWLDLLPINIVQTYIEGKINTALADTPPTRDCEDWLCDYCEVSEHCPFINKKQPTGGFNDER